MGTSVGIVTMVGNFNYGNRLQNFAVSKIFETMGCQAVTLDYRGRSIPSSMRHLASNVLLPHEATHPEEGMGDERKASFKRFSSLIPTRPVDVSLSKLQGDYDLFSVGSDQVWNPNYVDSYRWMFLEFAERQQRVTLAPSIGLSKLSSPYARHNIARGLRGFDQLSIRENDGATLIKELTGQSASVVIDPTLMLKPETWRKVSDGRMVPDGAYIFTYLLGDRSEEQDAYISEVATNSGAKILSLSDKSRPGEIDAGPAEFIALIDGASRVVTDSYHAAVFSILMNTPLTVFRREGRSNLFSRLETLTEKFGLEDAIFGSDAFDMAKERLDSSMDAVLARERRKLAEHLSLSSSRLDVSQIVEGV